MRNYEFVLLNDTHFVAIGAQLTRGLRGDSLRYLRSNVFFNVFYDTFGRANGRTRQMTKNDDNSARLRCRTSMRKPLSTVPLGAKKSGEKNPEIDTCEIEGKVLPLADDSRDGRVRELCFVASCEIEFRHLSARSISTFFLYNNENRLNHRRSHYRSQQNNLKIKQDNTKKVIQ